MMKLEFLALLLSFLAGLATPAQTNGEREYLGLAQETLRRPITADELRQAVLSPGGVESIRSLYERSIADSLLLRNTVVTPELGGEATLDRGHLTFVSYPDPIHPILREMVSLQSEPGKLLEFLQGSADGKEVLSNTGGLHALLYQITTQTPTDSDRELLRKAVDSAVATHFKTWTADPEIQQRMIRSTEWRGRYVGFWHIHPPRVAGAGFTEGIEPSFEDMNNAIQLGQFLTLVFQPDGFDAYDLAPLAAGRRPDLSLARIVRYRSPDWQAHFENVVRARR
ncbi:MAG: hypothetical protein ACRD1X_18100 [Vicinamibacteria bacterium]